ncbi:MAG: hypothetical protein JKY48_19805 [Flavobacteriales bacterium]|nr:hypothetical protein [Flavobacteriales bacterium]
MNKTHYIILLSLIPMFGMAQKEESVNSLEKRKSIYFSTSMGFSSSTFRDFATSPLFYKGIARYASIGRIRNDSMRESRLGGSYSTGNYKATVGDHSASSQVKTLALYYAQMYHLSKLSNDKWNTKVGGLVNVTGNLRINGSLGNNSAGLELNGTLFASIKTERDVSRVKTKNKKFLFFIKYKLKPRKRKLSYRLNLGLMNNNYRNPYVYIGQSSVLNDDKTFDAYEFKTFSGFRMSSSLDYTIALNNRNLIQFSYLWDAYRTGGDLDKFEMAQHVFKLSLLFNTK